MTTVNADRLALREAEAVKPASREEKRPSFEPHIRPHEEAEAAGKHVNGNATDDMQLRANALPHEESRPLPLVSTDAVFGEGATIYPQGLAVVGYLSMLPCPKAVVTANVEGPENGIVAAPSVRSLQQASGQPLTSAKSTEPPSHEFAPEAMSDIRRAQIATDADGDPLRMSADGPEFTAWLLRRLTFSGKGDNATLRLRDYRLARSDHRALAESLASMAKAQGWPVARIVVNGREVWRAPSLISPHHLAGEKPHVG